MTILHPRAFYESLPVQFDGVFHWDYIDEVLRPIRGITCADVDAMIEINGLFLSIETKTPGVEIQRGQQLRTNALLATGLVTQLDIWGKDIPIRWQWRHGYPYRRDDGFETHRDGRAAIAERVRRWAYWANALSAPARDYHWLTAAWRNACPDAREQFAKDCLNPSLGAFAGTPLGHAAIARAETRSVPHNVPRDEDFR